MGAKYIPYSCLQQEAEQRYQWSFSLVFCIHFLVIFSWQQQQKSTRSPTPSLPKLCSSVKYYKMLPRCLSGKESACQFRRLGFNLWVEKIPWSRKWQPTPVSCPWGNKESNTAERVCVHAHMHTHTISQYSFSHCLSRLFFQVLFSQVTKWL